jgi:hypothetical protein
MPNERENSTLQIPIMEIIDKDIKDIISVTSDDIYLMPFVEAKKKLVDAFEKEYLEKQLTRCNGNISLAAMASHLSRFSLYVLIKKFQVSARSFKKKVKSKTDREQVKPKEPRQEKTPYRITIVSETGVTIRCFTSLVRKSDDDFYEKRCRRCEEWWPIESFWLHKRKNYFHQIDSFCKACYSEIRTPNPVGRGKRREVHVTGGEQYFKCPSCKEMLPAESFYSNRKSYHGITSYCKKCSAEYQRRIYKPRHKKNPLKYYNRILGCWIGQGGINENRMRLSRTRI